jgi:hypothetical protein
MARKMCRGRFFKHRENVKMRMIIATTIRMNILTSIATNIMTLRVTNILMAELIRTRTMIRGRGMGAA